MKPAHFLEAVQPGGPWLITAIRGGAPSSTLAKAPGEVDALAAIHAGNDLYWTPAQLRNVPASGKPSKGDVAGSWLQWVDLDPPKAVADLDAWRADALARLQANGPTIIVDSGRGYWGFWQRATFSTDHAEIEGINRALADALGADHCWNIDRLARLPGTVNSKTGRPAAVIAWTPGPATLPAPVATPTATPANWTDGPCVGYSGPADATALIAKMRAAKSADGVFNDGVTFDDLWTANAAKLAQRWPARKPGDPFDRSEADASLATRVLWWTGHDCERTLRIMRQSALVREKWDRSDYLPRTIMTALPKVRGFYDPASRRAAQIAENARIGEELPEDTAPVVMALADMEDRLVFIGTTGAVADRVTGRIRKKDAASDEYAASWHSYQGDDGKAKKIPALKAWIASFNRKTVDVLTWIPGQAQICHPPETVAGATRAFNMWRGLAPMTAPDDWQARVAPFVDHMGYLVPVAAECRWLTQWTAHIVQRPWELPTTAVLMISPTTGIGRNWYASVLVRVLRGHVAAGIDLAPILDGRFNGRLSQKLLAIVDEVREGMGERKYARGEKLKSIITEEHRQIDIKYGLQSVEKNCCRWMMFSNYFDAVPFENNDRRVAVIANPIDRRAPDYYAWLYALLDDPAFIASVRRYLETVDLTDFRPGGHAPMNAAKIKALDEMMSETDRAVADYRDAYPAVELTTTASIRAYVQMQHGIKVEGRHLAQAIKRAGMTSTGKLVKIGGNVNRVVIVRGAWTPDDIKAASSEWLAAALTGGNAGNAGNADPKNVR